MPTRLFAAIVLLIGLVASPLAAADTLAAARKLAEERFSGWTYGSDSSKKQVDCVQFVLAVVEHVHSGPLDAESRRIILLSNFSEPEKKPENLAQLVAKNDPRIAGVQKALVDTGHGKPVAHSDAKPGDFIQYWMRKKDGTWFGHAAVIDHIRVHKGEKEPRAFLLGAHASLGKIGVGPKEGLRLFAADDRRIFVVRYK